MTTKKRGHGKLSLELPFDELAKPPLTLWRFPFHWFSSTVLSTIAFAFLGCAGGGNYNPPPQNSVPTVTSITPNAATRGGTAFTLTVNGLNFLSTSTVQWNGNSRSTSFVGPTQLTAQISVDDLSVAGIENVSVVNPAPGGGISAVNVFTVNNPSPTVSSLSPTSVAVGSGALTLVVNGSGFVSESQVHWNGSGRTTTFVSSTTLQASISSADVATASTVTVTVSTPTPGGGTSGGASFTIKAAIPAVAISPSSAIVAAGGQQQFEASVANTQDTSVTWQVNDITGGTPTLGRISSSGLYTAPSVAANVTISAVSQADNRQSASADLVVLAPHSIGVRPTPTVAEFFDKTTGSSFLPRGNDYIRLAWQTAPWGQSYYHSNFNVGLYDAVRTEAALTEMQQMGYNVVRIFLNGCCVNSIGDPSGGISSTYITNVVDFLNRAASHEIFALITWEWLPNWGGYSTGSCSEFGDVNVINLCAGGVSATVQFFHDLVQALVAQSARLDHIFAYELRNEYYYESDAAPLNWTSGTVTAADGQTYDMSNAASRQQMMDAGLIYFTDQVRSAILAVDPTALVTVGFFWPQEPNPTRLGDPRVIEVYPAMANSTVDFVDVHGYAISWDLTVPQLVQNYGFAGYQQQKPVLMGEFGAFKSDYLLISDAASALKNWQMQSCSYSVKGWLLWTWDTEEPEQVPPLWAATSGDGSVNDALSPATRPDPCQ